MADKELKKGIDYPGITVSFFCHDGAGNFILAKRSVNARDENGKWDGGGGAVEVGHTFEQTLRKEIAEEYCTEVLDFEFLGFREVFREHQGQPTHWISFDYKVLVDRDRVKNGEPRKFDELGWFRLDNLPQPIHSTAPKFLELYKDRL